MSISLIAALGKDRVIGNDNDLLWHLPADLTHFKALTMGKPIIMGRKTYESIGKALPGRHNIVMTRQKNVTYPECDVVGSLEDAITCAGDVGEVFVIGGGSVYEQALPMADTLYLTYVDSDATGKVYFPEWDEHQWQEISCEQHRADERNAYDYCFVVLKKLPR